MDRCNGGYLSITQRMDIHCCNGSKTMALLTPGIADTGQLKFSSSDNSAAKIQRINVYTTENWMAYFTFLYFCLLLEGLLS